MPTFAFVWLILFAPATEPNYAKRYDLPSLPQQIWGQWDHDLKSCQDKNSLTRLIVGIDWVAGYEYQGRLLFSTSGLTDGQSEATVAKFVMGGEGSTWERELTFTFSTNKRNSLRIAAEKKGEEEAFVRCIG
ncbi:MAG: hypothetical protein ACOVN5_07595 [Aquidulcibacter sp.]